MPPSMFQKNLKHGSGHNVKAKGKTTQYLFSEEWLTNVTELREMMHMNLEIKYSKSIENNPWASLFLKPENPIIYL